MEVQGRKMGEPVHLLLYQLASIGSFISWHSFPVRFHQCYFLKKDWVRIILQTCMPKALFHLLQPVLSWPSLYIDSEFQHYLLIIV